MAPTDMNIMPALEKAFWARTIRMSGLDCLLWRGVVKHGHPIINHKGRQYSALRVSWLIEYKLLPYDHKVIHNGACNNSACVEPTHLGLIQVDSPMTKEAFYSKLVKKVGT